MTELERAIGKAMRSAGYTGGPEVYERPLGDGFALCVQPALEDADDGGVDLWPLIWVRLPEAEEVLEGLGRDEVPWASCNPDVLVTVHGPGEVADAVAAFRRGVEE